MLQRQAKELKEAGVQAIARRDCSEYKELNGIAGVMKFKDGQVVVLYCEEQNWTIRIKNPIPFDRAVIYWRTAPAHIMIFEEGRQGHHHPVSEIYTRRGIEGVLSGAVAMLTELHGECTHELDLDALKQLAGDRPTYEKFEF
jgi:hypothetical protein